jgi:VWFA-related protein
MYRTFPYVCDAIADFIRRLDPADSVAIYTFSRNLSRAAPLTKDHVLARAGLTNAVAGDDTALFNSLLLTLRDAAKVSGRKAVVVFSNGPDNVSMVAPGDVGRVAEDEGIPIYVISTQDAAKDQMLAAALHSLTVRTGGALYWARNWQQQASAFAAVREDIGSSYTACYYPEPNQNDGFRRLTVELVPPGARSYRVRVRAGYQVQKRPPVSTQSVSGNPKN